MLLLSKLSVVVPLLLLAVTVAASPVALSDLTREVTHVRATQDEPIAREFKSIHEPGDGGADGHHGRRALAREFKSVHEPGDGGADGHHGRRAPEFKSIHEPGDGGADGKHGRRAYADE